MSVDVAIDTPTAIPNGDVLYETVNGEYRELPPMGAFEVSVAGVLFFFLKGYGRAQRVGRAEMEMLFLLEVSPKLELRPDVAFVRYDRWPRGKRVPQGAAWKIVPDLAVEVISPSNTWNEIVEKIADYFRTGVQLVWVVSPVTEQVYFYTAPNANRILNRDDTLDGGEVLPGFTLPLAQLFGEETD